MNYSISLINVVAIMGVVLLLLPPVYEWHKIGKKNGNG